MGETRTITKVTSHSVCFALIALFLSAATNRGTSQLKLDLGRKRFWYERGRTGKGKRKPALHKRIFPTLLFPSIRTSLPQVTGLGSSPETRGSRALTRRPLSDRTRTDCAPKYFSKSSFSSAVSSAGKCLTRRVRSPRGGESEAELWHPLDIGSGCSGAAISDTDSEPEKPLRNPQ